MNILTIVHYKGYSGEIHYSKEDNLFVGQVVNIVDSLNFHGKTIEECIDNFHFSVDDYNKLKENISKKEKKYAGQNR